MSEIERGGKGDGSGVSVEREGADVDAERHLGERAESEAEKERLSTGSAGSQADGNPYSKVKLYTALSVWDEGEDTHVPSPESA